MKEHLIAVQGATRRRGDRLILDHIDLTIGRGEIVTLIGPNGAGKSTLVRAILGLEPLDAGRIDRPDDLSVGYLPQRYQLDPALPLSVRRLLTLTEQHPQERLE